MRGAQGGGEGGWGGGKRKEPLVGEGQSGVVHWPKSTTGGGGWKQEGGAVCVVWVQEGFEVNKSA